jgi:hypothetical protein
MTTIAQNQNDTLFQSGKTNVAAAAGMNAEKYGMEALEAKVAAKVLDKMAVYSEGIADILSNLNLDAGKDTIYEVLFTKMFDHAVAVHGEELLLARSAPTQ